MLVKCKDTGEKIPVEDAYKYHVVSIKTGKSRNEYYSSKEACIKMHQKFVKCKDTGEKIPVEDAYKRQIINGKDGKLRYEYYSSEQAYLENQKKNAYRIKCINLLMEYLGYTPELKMPSLIYRKLSELEPYGYDVVFITLLKHKDPIIWALEHKSFPYETSKIFYLFAIINNNIKKYYDEKRKTESLRNRIEEEVVCVENITANRTSEKKSVREFLDD